MARVHGQHLLLVSTGVEQTKSKQTSTEANTSTMSASSIQQYELSASVVDMTPTCSQTSITSKPSFITTTTASTETPKSDPQRWKNTQTWKRNGFVTVGGSTKSNASTS
jgi:hypothetical protein